MSLRGEAPKIVQIETKYVKTDAVNFRDVVQSLTGKNSSTDWIGRNNNSINGVDTVKGGGGRVAMSSASGETTEENLLVSSSSSIQMMNNVVSFDGFMLPPMEMMPWSFS